MTEPQANRLQDAASAYLRSAAHQPVAWCQWGPEAFARAREENKPVLLDIGAVWCHWCHVMDRESYENEEVAELINRHFIAVKVDRDARPDIDARYQAAVSAISGQGGWPLTAFLTPEGKPFFGGTYFPPEDYFGRPGFKRVLANIAANYQTRQGEIRQSAHTLVEALCQAETFSGARRAFAPGVVDGIVNSIVKLFDVRSGGFGSAPKFPHSAALELLLERYQVTRERYLLTAITTTLDGMGRGGVYDQLGGGFHRYSVDDRWIVPHFEKMSYDNSELLKNYLHGYQVTGIPFYRQTAEGIIAWINTTLADRERGGFYASQDADYSLDDDGDYFTWTLDELRAVLPPEDNELIAQHYDVQEHGEMHHNPAKNVLWVARAAEDLAHERTVAVDEIERRLAAAKMKMLEARRQRPPPFVDTTLYVAWNGMLISAYLEAYRVLGREDCRQLALRTLNRLRESAWSDRWGFARRCPDDGQVAPDAWASGVLDDQVLMAAAFLDAFELTGEKGYFEQAERTIRLCLEKWWDPEEAGFFDRPKGAPPLAAGLEIPRKPFQDSPTPGANPVAAMVLLRLASYTMNNDYGEKARQTLEAFAGVAEAYGLFASTFGLAALLHTRQPLEVVIVGTRNDARTQALARAAHDTFRFGKAVLQYEPQELSAARLPAGLAATLPSLPGDAASEPRALVCINATCQPPLTQPDELAAAIAGAAR
ncbi:MAG: thioredoxin domain-containing protein [Terriglobia bacterium]